MDFDISWLLLGLPVAFVLGWLASRFDLRQLRLENHGGVEGFHVCWREFNHFEFFGFSWRRLGEWPSYRNRWDEHFFLRCIL